MRLVVKKRFQTDPYHYSTQAGVTHPQQWTTVDSLFIPFIPINLQFGELITIGTASPSPDRCLSVRKAGSRVCEFECFPGFNFLGNGELVGTWSGVSVLICMRLP